MLCLRATLRQHARSVRSQRRQLLINRAYASKASEPEGHSTSGASTSAATEKEPAPPTLRSSCLANTALEGVTYLKNQATIVALPDDEYPEWLWHILEPPDLPEDGPGGSLEKRRMRAERRQRIKDSNFMKTQ